MQVKDRDRRREHFASQVLELATDAVIAIDTRSRIVFCNPAAETMFGYTRDELIGETLERLVDPDKAPYHQAHVTHFLNSGEDARLMAERGEIRGQRRNGDCFPARATIMRIEMKDETWLAAIVEDLTEQYQVEQELRTLAYYDSLTGLPNRSLLHQRLNHALERAHRNHTTVALLFVDINDFKQINDNYGHSVGDRVLREVAGRFTECVRAGDTLARMGGDEFLVLLEGNPAGGRDRDMRPALGASQRLLAALDTPITVDEREFFVSASIGVCLYPDDARSVEEMVQFADLAMYEVKSSRDNRIGFYSPALAHRASRRMGLEQKLRSQLARSEDWPVHYQPLISLTDQRIIGVEALARWEDPEHGPVPPSEFIPIAEESGLMGTLGTRILRTACHDLRRWRAAGARLERIAVNVSPIQIAEADFSDLVFTILQEAGLEPETLELEITEGALVTQDARDLETLRAHGVRVALDDFGTGFSSMNYLKRLPADTLKIDSSFVQGIHQDPGDEAIISAVLSLVDNFGFAGVAEGIETEEQWQALRRWGCHCAQGFWFSKPLPADEILRLLRS